MTSSQIIMAAVSSTQNLTTGSKFDPTSRLNRTSYAIFLPYCKALLLYTTLNVFSNGSHALITVRVELS